MAFQKMIQTPSDRILKINKFLVGAETQMESWESIKMITLLLTHCRSV